MTQKHLNAWSALLGLFLLALIVAGCENPPTNPRPSPARTFDIEIVVKKTNQKFKSLVVDFGFCKSESGPNYREIEIDRADEVENLIRSLEESTAELKALKEQIKVKEDKQDMPKQ